MRAAVVNDQARFEVREVPDPEPGPGEIVVRVKACGICGSDLHMMEAKIVPAGAVMGHEASGVVERVGEGVEGLQPGDHVAVHPFDPCGKCPPCAGGATQRCVNNAFTTIGLGFRPGAYAELVALSAPMAVPVPAEADLEEMALAEPLAVALHGFHRAGFESGASVGVIGCGPIGACAVLCARLLGASSVWACDTNTFRAELAARLGADEAGSRPLDADFVFDCAGAHGTVDLAVASTHQGGKTVVLAVNIKGDSVYPFTWVTREVDIVPCLGYTLDEYRTCAEWIASGAAHLSPLITKRVGLEELDGAFFALLDGAPEGKVLVTP